ncbi:hypothetical protein CDAR_418341 [Caerostris darwini]|uniref:Secreted protein n=1 Tax=Caerostris darwini TaxID=1538125 RepID=A0AAV4WFY8_9ARAC|nr:hypothetical protein CDAR_418341 [Caerostris darwini]
MDCLKSVLQRLLMDLSLLEGTTQSVLVATALVHCFARTISNSPGLSRRLLPTKVISLKCSGDRGFCVGRHRCFVIRAALIKARDN